MSPRVYREAWTHARAIELLREESATAFDPRCVAALEAVLEREQRSDLPEMLDARLKPAIAV